MPPRKSNASNASGGGDTSTSAPLTGAQVQQAAAERSGYSIEDLAFPRTMVSRLAKSAVPPNTQMARDAQWAVWKSATVFVNYLASNAAEHAGRASKKTIQPPDVVDAVRDLELPNFTARLEAELAKWNDNQNEKRIAAKARAKDRASAAAAAKADDAKTDEADGDRHMDTYTKDGEDEAAAQLAAEAGAAGSPKTEPKATGAKGGANKADGEPAKKRARRSTLGEGQAVDDEDDEEMEEDEDGEEDEEEDEDEDDEDSEQEREEAELHPEDALEEKRPAEDEDEAMDSDGSD